MPNNFSEVPSLLREATPHSLMLAAASPPDLHGYFSLGTNADYTAAFIGEVPYFLEVNERMPHTFGQNQLHISQLAGWIRADRELPELPASEPDDRDHKITAYIAEWIRDGACLQVGGWQNAQRVVSRACRPSRARGPHGGAVRLFRPAGRRTAGCPAMLGI